MVAKTGPVGQNPIQGTVADSALTAPHQRKMHLVTANPVHPVRSTAPEHESAMQVATSHAQLPKHPRYRRSCSTSSESPHRHRHHCHRDSSLSSTSTSLYTSSLQIPHLHLIIDATTAAVNTAADVANVTALVQQVWHPSHVPHLYQDTCKTG